MKGQANEWQAIHSDVVSFARALSYDMGRHLLCRVSPMTRLVSNAQVFEKMGNPWVSPAEQERERLGIRTPPVKLASLPISGPQAKANAIRTRLASKLNSRTIGPVLFPSELRTPKPESDPDFDQFACELARPPEMRSEGPYVLSARKAPSPKNVGKLASPKATAAQRRAVNVLRALHAEQIRHRSGHRLVVIKEPEDV